MNNTHASNYEINVLSYIKPKAYNETKINTIKKV